VLEDFAYCGLSLMVWELEDARSHPTAFEVGLTLDENENTCSVGYRTETTCRNKRRELKAYRTETRTLSCPESESVLGSISAEISPASTVSKSTRASSGSTLLTSISLVLTLNKESSAPFLRGVVGVLGLLPSDFLVGEPGVMVKPAICFARGLDSVDMAALYRFVVEESKLDVEVSDITDGGLFGVNGILDDMALGFDDGVAGIGGMMRGSRYGDGLSLVVNGVGLSWLRRRGEVTRKFFLEVVEVAEVEPTFL